MLSDVRLPVPPASDVLPYVTFLCVKYCFVQYISIIVSAFLPTFRVLLLLCWTTPLMPKFNFDHVH